MNFRYFMWILYIENNNDDVPCIGVLFLSINIDYY